MKTLFIVLSFLISVSVYSQEKNKSDSLPEGVTKEWLNDLRDENGNMIIPGTRKDASSQIPEDPETDALQRKIFNGLNQFDNFGVSVSEAGDVNGDGYDDIIVGAMSHSSYTGRAYIFFGGIVMNTIADVTLTGDSVGIVFGNSVSSAGDVNGDGYSDVIVGAVGHSLYSGKAYIYFGGSFMNNIADVIMSEDPHIYFGTSVSSAGDVNGDGYSDVIVGAELYSSAIGRAYIFYGGTAMNNIADVTMTGEATSNYFGNSVSSAGDVNGDGFSDVIVGAFGYSANSGRAYVFFGGSAMNNVADITMTAEAAGNRFGGCVSSAGDVNGDGYSDIVIGAAEFGASVGKVYIFLGGPAMDNASDVTMTGESTSNLLGLSVSSAGDVNGDGYSDVIAGAIGYSSYTGRAYLFFGGQIMNNVADVTMNGEASGEQFGRVSSAGDVNGDGYSDIIVGAAAFNTSTGRVFLYDYYLKNEITHDLTMTGETTGNSFGTSVSSAGDVNGDGYSDVIVGASSYSGLTGRAYIFFGGQTMNNVADVTMTGEATNNQFGVSVSSAGDVNGDSYSDVIVGAYEYASFTGRAYIFFGGPSMNNVADAVMTGGAANDGFGVSVSSAGDVNGDGFSDVIAGAWGYSSNTGRAYIYFGGTAMNNTADVTMTGEAASNRFGFSVSAGDVNGDGYSDTFVGAYGYSAFTGRAYIYFGSSSPDNTADVMMTGEAANNYFGRSVSSAGDVNGDGFSDVIAGAWGYSSNTGRAYIYFGGIVMNDIPDVVLNGQSTNNYFGTSVSSAGDVNRDGYSDVISGAFGNSNNTGKAYLYMGGAAMNNIADVSMTGEALNNQFGISVSSAGDINGDSYSDLIAGAYAYSTSTGRAYIYTGSAISANPILNSVKDVPNDQGGKVALKWAKSSLDVPGNNTLTDYYVEMSYPPSGGNFSWIPAGTVSATKNLFYSYLVNTPEDSSAGSSTAFFFRVTARTSDPSVYWRSGILSGRSIDNIAPLMLSPFTAASVPGGVSLNWKRSTAPDLLNYVLYRNTSPGIDPYTEPVFSTTTDSTFLDASPLSGEYYYFVVAQDIHNNKSPVAVAPGPGLILNLSMYVQGFYNAGANTMVEDTVNVYLRNSTSPFSKVDSAKAKVNATGQGTFAFSNAMNNVNYYIELDHRNSIETWSNTAHPFTGNVLTYSFSTAASQAFGDNMVQIDTSPVNYAIFSGDINRDGTIDLSDIINVFNDANSFLSGYVQTDVTGDNFVDLSDLTLTFNNGNAFVSVITP